jgi:hypothetical protein
LCYANANLTQREKALEAMRFVEFWQEITATDPEWLYFDSKVAPYRELSQLNQRGLGFITIRRRGAAILRCLQALPPNQWQPPYSTPHIVAISASGMWPRLCNYQGTSVRCAKWQ